MFGFERVDIDFALWPVPAGTTGDAWIFR